MLISTIRVKGAACAVLTALPVFWAAGTYGLVEADAHFFTGRACIIHHALASRIANVAGLAAKAVRAHLWDWTTTVVDA
jgi:hypothetical protein